MKPVPFMKRRLLTFSLAALAIADWLTIPARGAAGVPLPEHPRPDFERADWVCLNGSWQFRFDAQNAGEAQGWAAGKAEFADTITVPFPWGSKLSGLTNRADIGWYRRTIQVPAAWQGRRVFLVVGACDWVTKGWLDGQALGEHRGGYTPFEFELTPNVKWGQDQQVVLRVDDTPHPFKLEGKQGYGPAKGIWQTVYLEARPALHLALLHYLPDIDASKVTVKAAFIPLGEMASHCLLLSATSPGTGNSARVEALVSVDLMVKRLVMPLALVLVNMSVWPS